MEACIVDVSHSLVSEKQMLQHTPEHVSDHTKKDITSTRQRLEVNETSNMPTYGKTQVFGLYGFSRTNDMSAILQVQCQNPLPSKSSGKAGDRRVP